MPYGDGTGPEGKGPRTGRGLGKCSDPDTNMPPAQPPRYGRGNRPRVGRRGRGMRRF